MMWFGSACQTAWNRKEQDKAHHRRKRRCGTRN
jgi:hypothetical protein